MKDTRRNQLKEFVEREFIGPDTIDFEGTKQENGEEILCTDSPSTRYIAGILFPKEVTEYSSSGVTEEELNEIEQLNEEDIVEEELPQYSGNKAEYLEDAEELINRSNAYRQSAMSLTVGISDNDVIWIYVNAASYDKVTLTDSQNGEKSHRYYRRPITWENNGQAIVLPTVYERIKSISIAETKLQLDITYRYKKGAFSIYTFTLENTNESPNAYNEELCYYQCKFRLESATGFCPLPDNQRINVINEDYLSNLLLYRNVRNYAIGHGCAADWDDSDNGVRWIETAIFPSYEVKPIVPSKIDGVSLEMLKYGPEGDLASNISELTLMCSKYEQWIESLINEAATLDNNYKNTAERHIENCKKCLRRMQNGIELLKSNTIVRTAFQYMNLAMLMQQLHYNLPLQKWEEDGNGGIRLACPVETKPNPYDSSTWYDKDNRVYGKWRPFQLAFILMNLESMSDKLSKDRKIVDLIWFPTGGGKTEAYLGLSAYTIFIRRLMNKDDAGTAILMRYTLRLLTAQQYERASSLICACELLRKKHAELFGCTPISIGLWVGSSTTPNSMKEAVAAYEKIYSNKSEENPFVLLKCPWCGAQMGIVKLESGVRKLPGYHKHVGLRGKKSILFVCGNNPERCEFTNVNNPLPLHIVDDVIYDKKPTLLLGTVDKFAMLPFRPEAQGLFGYYDGEKLTSPDLIIQDELHLISGPLGSMVGHYETLIDELCTMRSEGKEIHPKIIASTATISSAKEQCQALYGCAKEDVFQFPPAGLVAGDSFFSHENKAENGRQYVGILATGSSSDATTAIRLYATLLYAAKEMIVKEDSDKDPYWTNMGYFNSIRELGQARTWIRADIDQHLDVIYKRRFYDKIYSREDYRNKRRYIWRDEELTSRISGNRVTASLANLGIKYDGNDKNADGEYPIDICLATNMISVGLDVPRLGLMTVSGQPKTTSEYIQATSRVGRNAGSAPGIVFVLYRPGRPRDKSHYEHFKEYHSKLYCCVEPTSVTPFSAPVRDRALHAIMIGIMRLEQNQSYNESKPKIPNTELLEHIHKVISERLKTIDPEELKETLERMKWVLDQWTSYMPDCWAPKHNRDLSYTNDVPLMFWAGTHKNRAWGRAGLETPTSMRNVDSSCEAEISDIYRPRED